mmetsp:Transcript_32531/g.24043  ORF Transcript_32531/g.24043 Transcript_32531/m.24043 type:complete len:104 (-) Transcript_32531:254-565(-)
MNFSIAYGKTVHGFMKDWNCSREEAQATVDLWFADRPEVKQWQAKVQAVAQEKGWTLTLLGRYRSLLKHFKFSKIAEYKNKDLTPSQQILKEHGMRAAINTPI